MTIDEIKIAHPKCMKCRHLSSVECDTYIMGMERAVITYLCDWHDEIEIQYPDYEYCSEWEAYPTRKGGKHENPA